MAVPPHPGFVGGPEVAPGCRPPGAIERDLNGVRNLTPAESWDYDT
ncbi:hypothetical protein [Streptomyces mirabilis]